MSGFRPPHPVWLDSTENSSGSRSASSVTWLLLGVLVGTLAVALVLVAGLYLYPGVAKESPPSNTASASASITSTSPTSPPVGTCVDLLFSGDLTMVPDSGKVVSCDSESATYTRVASDALGEDCRAGLKVENRIVYPVSDGQMICLARLFKVDQCSPITTSELNSDTRMNLASVVPCDTETGGRYPALARVTGIVEQAADCPSWAWPTDSEQHICVVLVLS